MQTDALDVKWIWINVITSIKQAAMHCLIRLSDFKTDAHTVDALIKIDCSRNQPSILGHVTYYLISDKYNTAGSQKGHGLIHILLYFFFVNVAGSITEKSNQLDSLTSSSSWDFFLLSHDKQIVHFVHGDINLVSGVLAGYRRQKTVVFVKCHREMGVSLVSNQQGRPTGCHFNIKTPFHIWDFHDKGRSWDRLILIMGVPISFSVHYIFNEYTCTWKLLMYLRNSSVSYNPFHSSGPLFTKETTPFWYRDPSYKPKTVIRFIIRDMLFAKDVA